MGKFTGVILNRIPTGSGLKEKLSLLNPRLIKQSRNNNKIFHSHLSANNNGKLTKTNFFSGCLATHLYNDIASATACLHSSLNNGNMQTPADQTCCGLAAKARGDIAEARKLAEKNILAFSDNTLPVLTTCASCFHQLKNYPDLFRDEPQWLAKAQKFAARVEEFSTFFNNLIDLNIHCRMSGIKKSSIFYHDPCHIRFGPDKSILPPRQLLNKITGHKVVELNNGPQCCGHGGLFSLANPDLSNKIFQELFKQLRQTDADTVLTTCSGCLLQWQQKVADTKTSYCVEHLAVFFVKLLLPAK